MVQVHSVSLPLPTLAERVHVVQLTDLHFAWNTPQERLIAAVDHANALQPDLVVVTGGVVSWTRRSARRVAATLGRLRSERIAILGNHDHHVDAGLVTAALQDAGFEVLRNRAVPFRGLTVVGGDDPVTGHPAIGSIALLPAP